MEKLNNLPETTTTPVGAGRRSFLRNLGGIAVAGGVLAACSEADKISPNGSNAKVSAPGDTYNLGSGDFFILNYAYALEQLEAAFYEMVVANPYEGMNAYEKGLFEDIRDHEVIHREFFKAALGSNAIPSLTPNFSSINFRQRPVVLNIARTFEDTGVKAYNGAGKYIKNATYLGLAGKIVSVEARHAALLSELQFPFLDAFAGQTPIDGNGLERSLEPGEVIPMVSPFIREMLTGTMPTL